MVESQPSKLVVRVRFPSSAPKIQVSRLGFFHLCPKSDTELLYKDFYKTISETVLCIVSDICI